MYNKIVRTQPLKLVTRDLEDSLVKLKLNSTWKINENRTSLIRECVFPDFESTWAFLTRVSMRSHLWGHHPTITTSFNKVKLELSTHDLDDKGAISDIDLKMANRIEKYINIYNDKIRNLD
ncbi:hypothetical protein KAFR_0A02050 [Kazachstania africana CBS 2517]|uniref:4a-hydroxytetrahydrobiopterin dehydratase n=1 Tax=Kazachstania africana (strain ATCC 22294 / BCRC 22015 / CBS 2517 / CECT 1963 / NBRC 1671 / NRRL Y-8276) TaxID=1071382 RepID=H2AMP3_KAZAF|nr:hypothetical protein KAFR_0A02050 [Kazachstania africana CBS 2517]CCF55643.1 hypothetical protein KAFR_0A02050 [Kazachstania africana CBS 2517]